MYPIMVPCFGFDDHLAANIAIALTGMGVDMGQNLNDDVRGCGYFDDIYLNDLNKAYLDHKMTLKHFVEEVIEYFTSRSEPWGSKISVGVELLPIYRQFLPEMSMIIGMPGKDVFARTIFYDAMEFEKPADPTVWELWAKRGREDAALEELSQAVPTMLIPASFFEEQREKALIKVADFIGGARNREDRGRLVNRALKRLSLVYTLEESKQRMEMAAHG